MVKRLVFVAAIVAVTAVILFLGSFGVYFYTTVTPSPHKECINFRSNNSLQSSLLAPLKLQNAKVPDCPLTSPNLVGPIEVVMNSSLTENPEVYSHLKKGHGQPRDCKARNKVAIIVPFRNREAHLPVLLYNLHRMLEKQQADYSIFVIEQTQNSTFNRAKLLNIGFIEASKIYKWDCFIFHDVDLLPENDQNIYKCSEQPRHLSVAIDKFEYELPYLKIMGGITAFTPEQMKKINGFSNDYWGWGGEDDDGYTRVTLNGFHILRDPNEIAKYKAIAHTRDSLNEENPCKETLMRNTYWRSPCDGLSSCNYKIIKATRKPLYVHFLVDLLEEESRRRLHSEEKLFENC